MRFKKRRDSPGLRGQPKTGDKEDFSPWLRMIRRDKADRIPNQRLQAVRGARPRTRLTPDRCEVFSEKVANNQLGFQVDTPDQVPSCQRKIDDSGTVDVPVRTRLGYIVIPDRRDGLRCLRIKVSVRRRRLRLPTPVHSNIDVQPIADQHVDPDVRLMRGDIVELSVIPSRIRVVRVSERIPAQLKVTTERQPIDVGRTRVLVEVQELALRTDRKPDRIRVGRDQDKILEVVEEKIGRRYALPVD